MAGRPRIGVGVIVRKGEEVLVGKRKNSHGDGTWSFAGGHLEHGESIEECAAREVREEAGIEIENAEMEAITNDRFEEEGKHYVTIFVTADHAEGRPTVEEPDRFEEWAWHAWNDLPEPLFLPIRNLMEKGFNPFE